MKAFIEGDKYKVTLVQNWQIGAELGSVIQVIEVTARRTWWLLRAGVETGGFVTCDHPVCLNWTKKIMGPPTLVSANTSLIFPLSKELCLMGEVGGQDFVLDLDRQGVARVNGALVANAERYVFAADTRPAKAAVRAVDEAEIWLGRGALLLLCWRQFQGSRSAMRLAGMILQACEHVGEPGLRIDVVELGGLDQRVDGGGAPAAGVGAGEGPVVAGRRRCSAAPARRRCWSCTGGRRRGSGPARPRR